MIHTTGCSPYRTFVKKLYRPTMYQNCPQKKKRVSWLYLLAFPSSHVLHWSKFTPLNFQVLLLSLSRGYTNPVRPKLRFNFLFLIVVVTYGVHGGSFGVTLAGQESKQMVKCEHGCLVSQAYWLWVRQKLALNQSVFLTNWKTDLFIFSSVFLISKGLDLSRELGSSFPFYQGIPAPPEP